MSTLFAEFTRPLIFVPETELSLILMLRDPVIRPELAIFVPFSPVLLVVISELLPVVITLPVTLRPFLPVLFNVTVELTPLTVSFTPRPPAP